MDVSPLANLVMCNKKNGVFLVLFFFMGFFICFMELGCATSWSAQQRTK